MVDERIIEKRAMQHHLSVRIGCFCNPGAGEAAFHVTRDTVKRAFDGELDVTTYDDYVRVLDIPTMGSNPHSGHPEASSRTRRSSD